jgi:hypothetical protein
MEKHTRRLTILEMIKMKTKNTPINNPELKEALIKNSTEVSITPINYGKRKRKNLKQ